jgi:phenylpropionate dioxygenase-like ring-hydroxylating dioxygenase large terminal subunit
MSATSQDQSVKEQLARKIVDPAARKVRTASVAERAQNEAFGASQIGPFDYVPPLGFREYWYPVIEAKYIKPNKPRHWKVCGEDIVFFRGKPGSEDVQAISDWCPHRGARLSLGVSEFPGTITCPYHGYTFDGEGTCVAGLIDAPDTPVLGKMFAKSYPTRVFRGIVFVWMGETEPVPLEEDLPVEMIDPRNHWLFRRRVWDTNWTEAVNQGCDYHAGYLHRADFRYFGGLRFKFHGVINPRLTFFRPKGGYTGGARITVEEEHFIGSLPKDPHSGPQYHPGVDAVWPKKAWWRVLPPLKRSGRPTAETLAGTPQYQYSVELPSRVRIGGGSEKTSTYMRWMVPMDFEETVTWTLLIGRKPKTILGLLWKYIWYFGWRKPSQIIRINEWEDLVVFKKGRLRYDLPQKLGPMDANVIYFRRHLAKRSRDHLRLGGAHGAAKAPPIRTGYQWKQMEEAQKVREEAERRQEADASPAIAVEIPIG